MSFQFRGRELPRAIDSVRELASRSIPDEIWQFIEGGAGGGVTVATNRQAFREYSIVPILFQPNSERELKTSLFGVETRAPIITAPVAMHALVDPLGERATAAAAAASGLIYTHSMSASISIEDVAAANGAGVRWLQIYVPKSKELLESFVARASASDFSAVVVTVDTPFIGWRPHDVDNKFDPFRQGHGLANYTSDPVFRRIASVSHGGDAFAAWATQYAEASVTWSSIANICGDTEKPVLAKGILHPDDALRAIDCGVSAIIVSNHGGRQIDRCVPSLRALEAVVGIVNGQCPVLFDSGIRSGADVYISRCLGADAVLVGRPLLWGLATGGQEGVAHVLENIVRELQTLVALAGPPSLARVVRTGQIGSS